MDGRAVRVAVRARHSHRFALRAALYSHVHAVHPRLLPVSEGQTCARGSGVSCLRAHQVLPRHRNRVHGVAASVACLIGVYSHRIGNLAVERCDTWMARAPYFSDGSVRGAPDRPARPAIECDRPVVRYAVRSIVPLRSRVEPVTAQGVRDVAVRFHDRSQDRHTVDDRRDPRAPCQDARSGCAASCDRRRRSCGPAGCARHGHLSLRRAVVARRSAAGRHAVGTGPVGTDSGTVCLHGIHSLWSGRPLLRARLAHSIGISPPVGTCGAVCRRRVLGLDAQSIHPARRAPAPACCATLRSSDFATVPLRVGAGSQPPCDCGRAPPSTSRARRCSWRSTRSRGSSSRTSGAGAGHGT